MSKTQFLKKTSNLIPCVLFSFTLLSSDLVLGMDNDENAQEFIEVYKLNVEQSLDDSLKRSDQRNFSAKKNIINKNSRDKNISREYIKNDNKSLEYTFLDAINITRQAADSDNIKAIYVLADLYLDGKVPETSSEQAKEHARKLYLQAKNLGDPYAQDCLDDLDQPFDTQENSKEPCHQESTSEMSHEDKNNIWRTPKSNVSSWEVIQLNVSNFNINN